MLKITSHFRVVLFWVPLDPRCNTSAEAKSLRRCEVCHQGAAGMFARLAMGNPTGGGSWEHQRTSWS
jgi:hypothetical protein